MWDLDMDTSSKKNIVFFLRKLANDIKHFGNTKQRQGALIGLPELYEKTPEYFDGLLSTATDPDQRAWIKLFDLSKNAKKFAIASAVLYANKSWKDHVKGLIASLSVGSAYLINNGIKFWFGANLHKMESSLLILFCAMYALFVYWSFVDLYKCRIDKQVLEQTSAMGKDYTEGGFEYYDKIINRNLIKFKQGSGAGLFNSKGNRRYWLRTPNVPYTTRRSILLEKMNEQKRKVS